MPYAKINPTGCGIHKNRAKLRLDFFLNPGDPNYDKYPGSPFHSHFIYPDKDASDAEIKAEIEKCLNYFYAFHQHCWDTGQQFCGKNKDGNIVGLWERVPSVKGSIRDIFTRGEPKELSANQDKVQNILSRVHEFQISVSEVPPQDLNIGERGTIDVGSPAIDRAAFISVFSSPTYYTRISMDNPANATGTIDTVEVYCASAYTYNILKVGTFVHNGGYNFTCHDAEECGECDVGYNEFTGLSIDINSGEYIGADARYPTPLQLDRDSSGAGLCTKAGQYCDPEDTEDFSYSADQTISLYGTGPESGGVTHYGAATLSGVGTLATIGRGIFVGAATLAGTGTLAAIGSFLRYAKATLSGTGALSAIGSFLHSGKATLSGTGNLAAIGRGIFAGKVTLSGIGTLTASAVVGGIKYGVVALSGVGTLVSNGVIIAIGKASLTGIGSLSAIGRRIFTAKATLSGIGTLVAKGVIEEVITKAIGGVLNFTGEVNLIVLHILSLGGNLAFVGSLVKTTKKALSGVLTFLGGLIWVGRRLKMRLFQRPYLNMVVETKTYRNVSTETREVKP